MANASTVGALRVVLGLDSAAFEGGMTQAQAHLKRVGQQMQSVGNAMKVAGAAMVAAFVSAASGAATAVTVLSKNIVDLEAQAKTAGVSFEKFQSLKYAADRNSVSVAALTDGLKEMNLRADEFVKTGKGAGAEAFKRLGISATDLATRLKDPSALFEELIGRMQQLDKAGQIRVADEIFGGSGGEQFVRFLDKGVEGVRQLRAEFAKSGNFITPEQLAQAQKMQEAILKLKDALGNLARALLDTGLVQWFVDIATGFARLITKLNEAVPGFVKWASVIMVGVGALGALLVVAGTAVSSLGALTIAFAAAGASSTAATAGLAKFAAGLTAIARHPVVIALTAIVAAWAALQWNAERASRKASELSESLEEQAAAAGLVTDETGRLQTEMEANLPHVAAMTGQVHKLADAHFRAAAAIKAQRLEDKRKDLDKANSSLAEAQTAFARRQRQSRLETQAPNSVDAYGRPSATNGLTADQRTVRSEEFRNIRNATALVRHLTRDLRDEMSRGLETYIPPSFEDLSGGNGGGKGPKGKTAEQLAQEAEARRRAIEDMAAAFNLSEAQLLNDQDRVKVLEREEAVRQRTRALIDAGIITDKAAAGEEAERMQARLDAAMQQQTDRAFTATQNALGLDIARIEENYDLVRALERQAELAQRIESYQRMGKVLDEAQKQAALDIADLDRVRADAAQRRLADAREEHRLALAQLSGNERLTRQLQDQAEIRARTRRYQTEGNRSPVDAERQATNEVRLERAAARHGEAREMFSSAFSDGIRAAMAGDLKGFLSNQFGTFMSEAFKRLGQQLYDTIFGTFDAVAEGTAQGTAQGLAAGPQMIAAGQVVAMTIGDSIRAAGADLAAQIQGASVGGGGSGGSASSAMGAIARVASILKSLPGFASEGTIRASGASGIDSQLVAFWKSPREQVDIYQPGGRGSGGGGGMSIVQIEPSPYFDVRVQEVAGPMTIQAAATVYKATRNDQVSAQRRGRQRFV